MNRQSLNVDFWIEGKGCYCNNESENQSEGVFLFALWLYSQLQWDCWRYIITQWRGVATRGGVSPSGQWSHTHSHADSDTDYVNYRPISIISVSDFWTYPVDSRELFSLWMRGRRGHRRCKFCFRIKTSLWISSRASHNKSITVSSFW